MRPADDFVPQSIWDSTVSAPVQRPINPVKARPLLLLGGAAQAVTAASRGQLMHVQVQRPR